MSEWQTYKLREVGTLQRGRSRHRPRYAFHLFNGPYPFIQTGEVREARKYISTFENTYSEAGLAQSKLWPKSTLCITIAANIAELGILGFDACFPDSVLGFIPDTSKSDLDFVYYTLTHFQKQLKHIGEGSVQDNINLGTFEDIEFPFPRLSEQKAIASVLSSLDDKIDLLHRQNKTLEEMAETLFRQWFIEEVKEDWKLGTLEHLIDLKYGKALKQEDRSGSGYPVVASSGVVGFHNEYLVEGPGIVIGRKGTLGKVYFMEDSFYPIDTSYFIKTKIPESNLLFEYYLLKSSDFANMNSDSAVPGLNRNLALGTPVQIPPLERIAEFNKLAKPWFSKIYTNTKQIQTLEKIRDTLLPKLMSGEVRVEYKKVDAA
ncbi:restriction endonuclease subunit S [Acinetobacter pittii]|uniref:restriction endonuclease subunit S n=1 Tax=Acinetobacter pittii TaxID=48296 RepID=UPI002DB8B2B3|nr:restriction endonuclease subunit S [Acinetobacter pittii]MEB7641012.1 restriction endonuclease subunit S [Acinetobacter pittii]